MTRPLDPWLFRENEKLPAEGSFEYWDRASRPVLDLLSEPRDWTFLNDWIKQRAFGHARFRHVLAWLETRGKILSFTRVVRDPVSRRKKGHTYWVRREWWASHERQRQS